MEEEEEEEEGGWANKMSATEKAGIFLFFFFLRWYKYQRRRLIFLRFNWIMYAYFHLGMMKQFWPLQPARAGVGFTSCMFE